MSLVPFLKVATLGIISFTVNSFLPYLRLTVKIFQFLRLSTKFLAVLRLSVNPIETLGIVCYQKLIWVSGVIQSLPHPATSRFWMCHWTVILLCQAFLSLLPSPLPHLKFALPCNLRSRSLGLGSALGEKGKKNWRGQKTERKGWPLPPLQVTVIFLLFYPVFCLFCQLRSLVPG